MWRRKRCGIVKQVVLLLPLILLCSTCIVIKVTPLTRITEEGCVVRMSQEFCGAATMRIRYGIMYFVIPGYDLIFDMKSWQAHRRWNGFLKIWYKKLIFLCFSLIFFCDTKQFAMMNNLTFHVVVLLVWSMGFSSPEQPK